MTLGGVVQQGQTVVEIVSIGETFTVAAFVAPDDIAFIRPDLEIKVRITAYDASRYGALDGRERASVRVRYLPRMKKRRSMS